MKTSAANSRRHLVQLLLQCSQCSSDRRIHPCNDDTLVMMMMMMLDVRQNTLSLWHNYVLSRYSSYTIVQSVQSRSRWTQASELYVAALWVLRKVAAVSLSTSVFRLLGRLLESCVTPTPYPSIRCHPVIHSSASFLIFCINMQINSTTTLLRDVENRYLPYTWSVETQPN